MHVCVDRLSLTNIHTRNAPLQPRSQSIMPVWSNHIRKQFYIASRGKLESRYYIPYNKLLYSVFNKDSRFSVGPQQPSSPASRGAIDFMVYYEIMFNNKPVFALEIKDPKYLKWESARKEANQQILKRLESLSNQCPIPTLTALSAFGTKLRFYHVSKDRSLEDISSGGVGLEHWDEDLLERSGGEHLKAIFDDIKSACRDL
jgi:hypothetical protein